MVCGTWSSPLSRHLKQSFQVKSCKQRTVCAPQSLLSSNASVKVQPIKTGTSCIFSCVCIAVPFLLSSIATEHNSNEIAPLGEKKERILWQAVPCFLKWHLRLLCLGVTTQLQGLRFAIPQHLATAHFTKLIYITAGMLSLGTWVLVLCYCEDQQLLS